MSLPDEKQVERALRYLEESEEAHARAMARKERMESELKISRDVAFLEADGTVAERQAHAGVSATYRAAVEAMESAYVEAEILKSKRQRAILTLEIWRSLNASRRAGVV